MPTTKRKSRRWVPAGALGLAAGLAALIGWGVTLRGAAPAGPVPLAAAPRPGLEPEERATIAVFREACPSVVFITSLVLHAKEVGLDPMEMPEGTGTGFVWDQRGHVVTNFHVIASGDAVQVTLEDRSTWKARLMGAAPEKDLAVLEIEAPADLLHPLVIGDSHDLQVGQKVLAIGNPFGFDHSLTTGIVSAFGREIDPEGGLPIRDLIQTDAAINPGNSGGPLLDSAGRLIGVNAAIYSPSGASSGVGFAIPAHTVRWVVPQLIEHGRIQRPSLGFELGPDSLARAAGLTGALVMRVEPGGPADRAGILGVRREPGGGWLLGDLVESLDGKPVERSTDLLLLLEERKQGEKVTLGLSRAGQRWSVGLTLATPPAHAVEGDARGEEGP